MIRHRIVIVTGLSGSGKSTAMEALEDAGFYCVDNLPVSLLPKFLEMPLEFNRDLAGLAFAMDLREKRFLENYERIFSSLKTKGYRLEIVFLEASEQIILQRYSQTRRHHPMNAGNSLFESIRLERQELKPLRAAADLILDTSIWTVHELKSRIKAIVSRERKPPTLKLHVMSFGYKHGIPFDADLIMDVRFLSNPYFVPELQSLDGESKAVQDYVLKDPNAGRFLHLYLELLDFLIPLYEKEGKAYLTIAIGCTGGQHRSVTLSRMIHDHIQGKNWNVKLTHRDIGKLGAAPAS
ncbi:MAG: RNase adapter RapZ [Desulfobacterales bacterium]